MGNKALSSPIPSFAVAVRSLADAEVEHLGGVFKSMSRGRDIVTLQSFVEGAKCAAYPKKYVLPRLFATIDTKHDGVLDFEEFLSAVALFRVGTTEEKINVLFLMYEPNKTGYLMREQLRKLLVDALMVAQRQDVPLAQAEQWIQEQSELSQGMVDMALMQFSSSSEADAAAAAKAVAATGGAAGTVGGSLSLAEFISFVALEGSIQGLLGLLPSIVDL